MYRAILILVLFFSIAAHADDVQHLHRRAQAQNAAQEAPHDPGIFYKFVHSLAPEAAVKMWRGGARPDLPTLMTLRGFVPGSPVYLRIFKEEDVIEAWVKKGDRFALFEIYPICVKSGALGPKQREGDRQAPEGFYEVGEKQLNPNSSYHLSFNLGYPNAYDQSLGRTGGMLMVHGACASIGCYALTDANIDEVYGLVQSALANGQVSVPVHAFPFRMTREAFIKHADSPWAGFWMHELLPAYQAFAASGLPPRLMACDGHYQIMPDDADETAPLPEGCAAITAWP